MAGKKLVIIINGKGGCVNEYPYDCVYSNEAPLAVLEEHFMDYFYRFIAPSWQESH